DRDLRILQRSDADEPSVGAVESQILLVIDQIPARILFLLEHKHPLARLWIESRSIVFFGRTRFATSQNARSRKSASYCAARAARFLGNRGHYLAHIGGLLRVQYLRKSLRRLVGLDLGFH